MAQQRWSHSVNQKSDALDLEKGVFTWDDPTKIAASLKRSAEASRRRKGSARQSATSMLNLYINRGGKNLPASRKKTLDQAKLELKRLFDDEAAA